MCKYTLLKHPTVPSFSFHALLNPNPFPGARLGQGEKPCLSFLFDAHLNSSFSKVMGGYGKGLELDQETGWRIEESKN